MYIIDKTFIDCRKPFDEGADVLRLIQALETGQSLLRRWPAQWKCSAFRAGEKLFPPLPCGEGPFGSAFDLIVNHFGGPDDFIPCDRPEDSVGQRTFPKSRSAHALEEGGERSRPFSIGRESAAKMNYASWVKG